LERSVVTTPLQVAVVDDDSSARSALARLLKSAGIQTVTFPSAREFLDDPSAGAVGCAVIDLWMPEINGLALQEELEKKLPHLSVVFVSGGGDVSTSVHAMKVGAVDFLEKPVSKEALLAAVGLAIERTRATKAAHQKSEILHQRYHTLTRREREVFALITAGLLNKQAGAELGAAEKTIKVHRAHVMEKMRAGSLADLVRMAERLGLGPNGESTGPAPPAVRTGAGVQR
jgi:FixJ family two-component response regulator